jgi:hypothetical protein
MIAYLMSDMGSYLGVKYEADGTSTSSKDSRDLFLEFGYTCSQVTDYTAYTSYIITKEIDAKRPIWIRGQDSDGGHAWVIDAYKRTNITKEYYQKNYPYALTYTDFENTNTYYRCIWGFTNQYFPTYCLVTEFYTPNNIKFIYNIKPTM